MNHLLASPPLSYTAAPPINNVVILRFTRMFLAGFAPFKTIETRPTPT